MLEITLKFDPSNGEDTRRLVELAHFFSQSPVMTPYLDAPLDNRNSARSTVGAEPSTSAFAGPSDFSPLQTNAALVVDGVVEVDAEGFPWDERIHSGAKSKTQAGTWTRRRNVPDEHYHRIRAELRGEDVPQFGASAIPAPPQAAAQAIPPPPSGAMTQAAPQPDVRVPPPPTGGNPFVQTVKRVSDGIKEGKWSHDTVSQLIASLGDPVVTKLPDFSAHHELLPAFNSLLDSLG